MVQSVCDYHQALDPAKFGFLPDVTARYASWLPRRATDPNSVLLLAQVGDTPAGFFVGEVLDEIPIYCLKRYGFIHDLWVEPQFRRSGIGRALVADAIRRFTAMGVSQIRGDTAEANSAARTMLTTLGFVTSTREVLLSLSTSPQRNT